MQTYQEELQENARILQSFIEQDKEWAQLAGKTILISGATGMIGKCLIDLLMQYNDRRRADVWEPIRIVALSRNEERAKERLTEHWHKEVFRFFPCDVTQGIPECGQVDYVIHAASNTHPLQYANDAVGTITANVIGLKELLDYAVMHQTKRFCFLSSVEIYGENRGDTDRFREGYLGYLDCNTLRAGYPESKRVGEALCNAYAKAHQLDFVIPRLSRVYGPTMLSSDSKAIAQFIGKAAAGEDIVLKSAGGQLYSYTYVMDAVMGILTVLLKGGCGKAYNISDTGSEVTLREICEWLAQDNQVNIISDMPEAAEAAGYSTATKAMLDTEKIEALGWKPQTHMREGLHKTVQALTC
ncbi:MAG: NAD-dependent epimerase/dehydratase family protein [Lachnospiraceae bacterium]|nr:NAD-dependent epimerase/dehydratase family protein [Lachnospiraceae bacterium]